MIGIVYPQPHKKLEIQYLEEASHCVIMNVRPEKRRFMRVV